MHIDTAGTYTLQYTATDSCGNETIEERTVEVAAPPIYGAAWDGSSDPKWVRTDGAANFSDPQPAIANGTGSSPFDDIMPWSGMEIVEDAEAGTLVSIPKYWYKLFITGENTIQVQITNRPLDGFSVSPAHRDRGDGAGERDVVYVGRYFSASDYKSKTNVQPLVSKTRGEFRNGITALGSDIWQYDFSMYWTIAFLYIVEYATWNSQAAIGYGCGDFPNVPNTGSTDAMQYHTGTDAASRTEYGNVQYRHIEGLWSGLYSWVDGIVIWTRDIYEYDNPSDYSDTTEDLPAGLRLPIYNGVPLSWGLHEGSYWRMRPIKSDNTSVSNQTRSCDSIYVSTSTSNLMMRMGGNYATQDNGLFCWDTTSLTGESRAYIGSRLQKLPSA